MANYDFRVGVISLAEFLNVQPEAGLDPFDPGYRQPQFTDNPVVAGGQLVTTREGVKETQWPLALQPREYVATNAMQNPGLEMGTASHWDNAAWAGGVGAVTSDWAPPGGDYSMKYSGTTADQTLGNGRVGVANASYAPVPSVNGNWRVNAAITLAGPSPVYAELRVLSHSSGVASEITSVVVATVSTADLQAAWLDGRRGVRLEGVATAHASAAFTRAVLRSGATGIATFSQPEMYVARSQQVYLTPANTPTAGLPAGAVDWFSGDSLDAYWTGERSNSYSVTRYGKQGLQDMRARLSNELRKADGGAGLRMRFRDEGASQVTWFDVVDGQLDPGYHYFRSLHNWSDEMLRLRLQPFGHTATERVIATGQASGVIVDVAVPTSLQGDVPAVLDARITAGDAVPSVGRRVALSVIGHPSYSPQFAAASIGDRQAGATLVGQAGAAGSQYLALPVSPTGASGVAAMVPMPIPTVYAGRNRVFALARSRLNGGVALRIFDPFGNAIGPTALATAQENWGLLDMGVLSVPHGQVPTSFKLPLVAGGASGNTVAASPGLHLNALFVLPEDQTVLVNDVGAVATTLAGDDFAGADSALTGLADDHGNTWRLGRSQASQSLILNDGYAQNGPIVTSPSGLSGNYIDRSVNDCESVARVLLDTAASGMSFSVRRDVSASYYIDAAYQHLPSRTLSLISVASGATTVHASQAMASLAQISNYYLTLRTLGGQAYVNLAREDGATVFLAGPSGVTTASIGASHAFLGQAGNPGLNIRQQGGETPRFLDFAVRSIPSSPLAARDVYRFSVDGQITRNPSGLDITAYLNGQARGQVPQAPAPTCARIVALVAPVDQGPANELVALDVRARDRFGFLR